MAPSKHERGGAMMHVPSQRSQSRVRLPVLEQITSRRKFTRYALLSLLGAFAATSAVATVRSLYPTTVKGFGARVTAGSVAEVNATLVGQGYVRNDAGHFYLLSAEQGAAIAVYWKCKHLGCTVPPPGANGRIECPCHNSWYDGKTGALLKGPATHPLDFIPVTIENGNVVVDTSKVMTRDAYDPSQATLLG